MSLNRLLLVFLILSSSCFCFGQTGSKTEVQNHVTTGTLQITKTVPSTDIARDFEMPLQCDAEGNVYLKSDSDGFPAIHKISPKGERTATFVPGSCSDIKVRHTGQSFVAQDGRVYQVAFPADEPPYVLVFDDDGTCNSKIKLDTPFSFAPYQLVVLPSRGNMLISGTRWRADLQQYVPYTALFSSSGTILKEVDLHSDSEEPQDANGSANTKDERAQLHAVSGGAMALAADNNVYLIRKEATPTIYAISEGGAVTRHFHVDSGEAKMVPEGMQIAGNRIAVLFEGPKASRALIKVVDLEGKQLAQYEAPTRNGRTTLGAVFACYSYPPEDFTFLTNVKDDKVVLRTVEPR
jgi:hypothetical protein